MLKMWVCWMIIFHGDFQIVWKIYVPSTLDLKGKKAGYLFILSLCTTIKNTRKSAHSNMSFIIT